MKPSEWTDEDFQDVCRYGACFCGRPRRSHFGRDSEGAAWHWLSCDIEGHGPDPNPIRPGGHIGPTPRTDKPAKLLVDGRGERI